MQELCTVFRGSFLVVGVGSPLRSDDQAGLLFCEELSKRGVECVVCEYGLENCLGDIYSRRPKTLIVVDAAVFEGGSPGDVIVASESNLLEDRLQPVSTHSIPLHVIVDMLKREGVVERVYVVGIHPKTLEIGVEVSREVLETIKSLADVVASCVEKVRGEMQ